MLSVTKNELILHEAVIENISIRKNIVSLILQDENNKIFIANKESKFEEIICNSIDIAIKGLKRGFEYEHIDIVLFRKARRKFVDFNKLTKLINKHGLKIYINFYSSLAEGILIQGLLGCYEVEIVFSEIEDITIS